MTSTQPTTPTLGAPPPLPTPGSGTSGREELPGPSPVTRSCAGSSAWRTVGIAALWLLFIWAVSGGFWLAWVLVPIGVMMLTKGLHRGSSPAGHATRCG